MSSSGRLAVPILETISRHNQRDVLFASGIAIRTVVLVQATLWRAETKAGPAVSLTAHFANASKSRRCTAKATLDQIAQFYAISAAECAALRASPHNAKDAVSVPRLPGDTGQRRSCPFGADLPRLR
jgi:hypothetical protein